MPWRSRRRCSRSMMLHSDRSVFGFIWILMCVAFADPCGPSQLQRELGVRLFRAGDFGRVMPAAQSIYRR